MSQAINIKAEGKLMKAAFFIFFITGLFMPLWAIGSWNPKADTYYFRMDFYSLNGQQFYDIDGKLRNYGDYTRHYSGFYLEHCFLDNFKTSFSFPYILHFLGEDDPVSGIGDGEFMLHYLYTNNWLPLAVDFGAGIPFASTGRGDSLDLGDGELNLILALSGRKLFWSKKLLFYAQTAYNKRTSEFTDEWRFKIKVGWNIYSGLWLAGLAQGQYTVFTPNTYIYNPYQIDNEGSRYWRAGVQAVIPSGDKARLLITYMAKPVTPAYSVINLGIINFSFEFDIN